MNNYIHELLIVNGLVLLVLFICILIHISLRKEYYRKMDRIDIDVIMCSIYFILIFMDIMFSGIWLCLALGVNV